MKKLCLNLFITGTISLFSLSIHAEQTVGGKVQKVTVVNYGKGAAYVYFKGANFDECPSHTNWCAIDFSLPAAKEMYSAVLAAKIAGKEIKVTSNSCWSTNYARCWKVHIE